MYANFCKPVKISLHLSRYSINEGTSKSSFLTQPLWPSVVRVDAMERAQVEVRYRAVGTSWEVKIIVNGVKSNFWKWQHNGVTHLYNIMTSHFPNFVVYDLISLWAMLRERKRVHENHIPLLFLAVGTLLPNAISLPFSSFPTLSRLW